jgi:hypothetical protein
MSSRCEASAETLSLVLSLLRLLVGCFWRLTHGSSLSGIGLTQPSLSAACLSLVEEVALGPSCRPVLSKSHQIIRGTRAFFLQRYFCGNPLTCLARTVNCRNCNQTFRVASFSVIELAGLPLFEILRSLASRQPSLRIGRTR